MERLFACFPASYIVRSLMLGPFERCFGDASSGLHGEERYLVRGDLSQHEKPFSVGGFQSINLIVSSLCPHILPTSQEGLRH